MVGVRSTSGQHGSEIEVGPIWRRCGVLLRPFWGRSAADSGSVGCRSGVDSGSTPGRSFVNLWPIYRRYGIDIASPWGRSCVDMALVHLLALVHTLGRASAALTPQAGAASALQRYRAERRLCSAPQAGPLTSFLRPPPSAASGWKLRCAVQRTSRGRPRGSSRGPWDSWAPTFQQTARASGQNTHMHPHTFMLVCTHAYTAIHVLGCPTSVPERRRTCTHIDTLRYAMLGYLLGSAFWAKHRPRFGRHRDPDSAAVGPGSARSEPKLSEFGRAPPSIHRIRAEYHQRWARLGPPWAVGRHLLRNAGRAFARTQA